MHEDNPEIELTILTIGVITVIALAYLYVG